MNPQTMMRVIAALCRQYGTRVEGGYLVKIPYEVIMAIQPTETITELPPDYNFRGVQLVYNAEGSTIDGGKMEFVPEEPASPPQPDYPVLETPVETVAE